MNKTKISWTDSTWNFITGCSRVSPGCERCYAERLDLRFRKDAKPWTAQNAAHNVRIHEEKLALPIHWKKPRKVFVNSMSDLFHERVPEAILRQAFVTMAMCPQHTFQILTKRPARMKAFIESLVAEQDFFLDHWQGGGEHSDSFPNVWLGVSVEDQRRADERIPLLLQTPAAVRFLSCEPLLEPVSLANALTPNDDDWDAVNLIDQEPTPEEFIEENELEGDYINFDDRLVRNPEWIEHHNCRVRRAKLAALGRQLHWVIAGGESGPHYREMKTEWATWIRDQCESAEIPFWFKQHSGARSEMNPLLEGKEYRQFPER